MYRPVMSDVYFLYSFHICTLSRKKSSLSCAGIVIALSAKRLFFYIFHLNIRYLYKPLFALFAIDAVIIFAHQRFPKSILIKKKAS